MPFSPDDLVACLRWWWAEPRRKPLVWGGPKEDPTLAPDGSFPDQAGPAIRWWCEETGVAYDHEGYEIMTARHSPELHGRVVSAQIGRRVWFALHPEEDAAAYEAALRRIQDAGYAVPDWL